MLTRTSFVISAFLALCAPSFGNQDIGDHGWPGASVMVATPPSPSPQIVHILDDFSLLETLEERTAAQHLLQDLASGIPHGGGLLLATPYFDSAYALAFASSAFLENIQGVAAPHFHLETLGLLGTINFGYFFAIAYLVRAL